jgi:hypothetical protein
MHTVTNGGNGSLFTRNRHFVNFKKLRWQSSQRINPWRLSVECCVSPQLPIQLSVGAS